MSKKSIFILVLILFTSAANNIFGFLVNIEVDDADSSKIKKECKINRLDIKSEKNKDYKHWEISPILASRPGVEINIFYKSHKTKFSIYEKIDSTNFKLKRIRFGNSVSGLSIKYLPGEDDIPKYDKVHNKSSLTYINEKSRQSFTIGHKSRDLHGNFENEISNGFGCAFGYGFVIDDDVRHYVSGANNYGEQDVDVHFYFEFEPTWENDNFILGVNYNTYFHQFAGKVGYKF